MAHELVHSFGIKIAKTYKVKKTNSITVVSKKISAVVILENGTYKARITTSPVEGCPTEYRVLPFTPNSLTLKGKTYVFTKNKDKYGKYVCVIRDANKANFSPGIDEQYDIFKPGVVISGRIIKKDGVLYFDYIDLIAYKENGKLIDNLNVDR